MLCSRKALPHPRDGPWAWLVCFCCFSINFIIFGLALAYGVLLPVFMKEFNTSKGVTAWIGSLSMALSFGCGPLSVKIIAIFGERPVGVFIGFTVAGLVLASSFAKKISILFITYGALYGICANLLLCSTTKILQKYFKRHFGTACGITTSGGSVGVLALSPLMQALVDLLGWRTALQVMSGVLVLSALACFSFDPNVENEKVEHHISSEGEHSTTKQHGRNFDCSIWKSPKYTIATISIFLNFLCLLVPLVHLVTFAKDRNIPPSKSSLLYIVSGACSTISRIVIGKIVDKKWLNPLHCIQLGSYIIGLSLIFFTLAKTYFHFILCIFFYAIGNGMFVTTQYNFLLTCFKERKKSYFGLTMCYVVTSFGLLSGTPIAGFVADAFNSYIPTFYLFGGLIIFSGTLPFLLLLLKPREENTEFDQQLQVIGSRLANARSSQIINL